MTYPNPNDPYQQYGQGQQPHTPPGQNFGNQETFIGQPSDPYGQAYPPVDPYAQAYPQPDPYGGYNPQAYGYPVYQPTKTNGMAIASLVVSLGSLVICGGFVSWLGAIFGHVALGQIKRTGEEGRGLAIAGIIIGWILTGLVVILIGVLVIVGVAAESSSS